MSASRREVIEQCAQEAHLFARCLAECEPNVYPNLCGACAIASAYLLNLLTERGVEARIVSGVNHAYVRVGKLYVDVTGEQFGIEPVYIAVKRPREDAWFWDEVWSAPSVDEFLKVCENDRREWHWDAKRVRQYVPRLEAA